MSEVNDELKNKIRRERILEIIYNQKNKLVTNRTTFYNSAMPKIDAYYKSPKQFTLKAVTEDVVIASKNEKIKKDCIDFLNTIPTFKVDVKLIEAFNEMDIDDVLLNTYLYFLGVKINSITPSLSEETLITMTIDEVEEMLDELIAKKESEENKESKKSWWNIF